MDETADLSGVGLGLVSEVVSGRPSVLNVNAIEPSGAAAKSGLIMLGDTLFQVDGRDVTSMLPNQVNGLLMGVPGTSITLSIKRGSGWPFTVRLTRSLPASEPQDDFADLFPGDAGFSGGVLPSASRPQDDFADLLQGDAVFSRGVFASSGPNQPN